jgi:hypothetical protein
VRKWLKADPGLEVEVWIPRDDLDIVVFRGILSRFQAMYEGVWKEDALFVDQDTGYDPPFFTLYTFPSFNELGRLNAEFRRMEDEDLNGFSIVIENYPEDEEEDIETIFTSHFIPGGGAEPSDNEEGDDDASDNDHVSGTLSTVSHEAASPDRDAILHGEN